MSRRNLFRSSCLTPRLASRLASLLAAVVAFGLATGSRAKPPRTAGQRVEATADTAATDATTAANDAAITASIKAELARDTELSTLRINVDTKEDRVALRGTAPNALARDRAARLAATVEGVRSVDNQILLNSSSSG